MTEKRVTISSIVEEQLPQYVKEEFPLVSEFLYQYYLSIENQGGPIDILQNIDKYVKIDTVSNTTDYTITTSEIALNSTVIEVKSTSGFADKYGLLLIDNEIITYTNKTPTSFTGCIRGFSGVTSYENKQNPEQLIFNESEASFHEKDSEVKNLSVLFLKEFFKKIKKQLTPGFEDRELYSDLNENVFVKHAKDFYSSKGTNASFEILFRVLYGADVDVIKPRDFLIQPSDAQYIISKDLIVEKVSGDPLKLKNSTLYQDETDFFRRSRGTIIDVERLSKGNKNYYRISLDYNPSRDIDVTGTVLGNFSIHPKTKVVSPVSIGNTFIDVDSTIGFPKSGTLTASLSNGSSVSIGYSSKSINQFFDCKNINQSIPDGQEISLDSYAYGYSGIDTSSIIKVRVTGVLSNLNVPKRGSYFKKKDKVIIKTLGKTSSNIKANNWFFNVCSNFDVLSVQLLNASNYTYRVYLYDNHSFSIGDSVTLISSSGVKNTGNVSFINDSTSFTIVNQGFLDLTEYYFLKKNILKANSKNYPQLNIYNANVQNIYLDKFENEIYVASSSIPNYLNQPLTIDDRSGTISIGGTFYTDILKINNHGFYTGDSVVYNGDIIPNGSYFVKKVDDNNIKLAKSRHDIFKEKYISANGVIDYGKIIFKDFCSPSLNPYSLQSQKLMRLLTVPLDTEEKYETLPGYNGIFINGVEILNYKSKDSVYYGPIEEIIVTSEGSDYDVISPPILTIYDSIGVGATSHCSIIGELERIDIIDPGFDYIEEPIITINGGNGTGASAKAKLTSFIHSINFNSVSGVNTTTNTIKFEEYHKFRDVEEVIYTTNGGKGIVGLVTNSSYFVSVQDEYTIKLYKSFPDASLKVNPISLIEPGSKFHTLTSKNKKKRLGSISVENTGKNYENKKTVVSSVGVNTSKSTITIKNHGYKTGEIVSYFSTESTIGGLENNASYYITTVDENEFKLSKIGIGTNITNDFYYNTKQYIQFGNVGSGKHIFNYPKITVSIEGKIGVSTFSNQNFNAIINPIFKGSINSVFVESGGNFYGSQDIINYNRQPLFVLNSGEGAQVTPIISNGSIVDVVINNEGKNYTSSPDLIITSENGSNAIISPVITNGKLTDVKIISGGIGYETENTGISIISSGSGANFYSKTKSWRINLVERLIQTKKITEDDGIINDGINSDFGLEYSHAYSPRSLRKSVLSAKLSDGKYTYAPDLQISDDSQTEINSTEHSPIIGWSYDGHPIYGPYGYFTQSGGSIKILSSGYSPITELSEYRPSLSLYPNGFFVEDYEYTGSGDLDEYNGRFCITPEFPEGIYAYFCTIDPDSIEKTGSFKNYKKPVFPYIIGNYFKSQPIEFNFSTFSNQDDFDFEENNLFRNTSVYNLNANNSGYDYLLNPNSINPQISEIKTISSGKVQSVGILTGGNNYQVGDDIVFDNEGTSGSNAYAKVSFVGGKEITQISAATSSILGVELYKLDNNSNSFIGFSSVPHYLIDKDLIRITSTYEINKFSTIKVKSNILNLKTEVIPTANTGIITYFNVSGFLNYPKIRENDVYQINNEQIKILNVDGLNSRIRVIRNYNGTSGIVTHSVGAALTEISRKFEFDLGITSSFYNYNHNKEIYFNPSESVGVGTSAYKTIYFTNPGAGITHITIPRQSIYIPNHKLNNGDSLIYNNNGGTSISISTNGVSSYQLLDKSTVYVAKISNDLIGISTLPVGIGSDGYFVGIGNTTSNILYFTGIGTGSYHSFKTNINNSLIADISKYLVTVSTSSTHGLEVGSNVFVDVIPGISTTIVIKYNDYHRRIVANPRSFISSDVNLTDSTITIHSHRYTQGQKVIHTSSSPCDGLSNQKIYYVQIIDHNRIRLLESFYESTKSIPNFVKILSSSFGTLSQVNPPIIVTANNEVIFDLSDSSLSFTQNGVKKSAFDFDFYTDSKFKNKFSGSSFIFPFEVNKTGVIGVSLDAKISLKLGSSVNRKLLFYCLKPINDPNLPQSKKDIIIDDEQIKNNRLIILSSDYCGDHKIVSISTNTFSYNLFNIPEKSSYTQSEGILKYFTNSNLAYGPIESISVTSGGSGFESLPKIKYISSKIGSGAILEPESSNIGNVVKKEILDIGFDYSVDNTVKPTALLPTILKLNPFYTLDSIGITSVGKYYYTSPDLVVIDELRNKSVPDVILKYEIGDSSVKILKNTKAIYGSSVKLIPVNNPNGIGIGSIYFSDSTKDVVVTFGSSFSNISDFPFSVGDKILVENVSVGSGSTSKGFNSKNYDYSLFTITNTTPNIGGIGSITYSMKDYLVGNENPGVYDKENSLATIVPEKYFPQFNVKVRPNVFYENEFVFTVNNSGICQEWDDKNGFLKVNTSGYFIDGTIIKGESSGSEGQIVSSNSYECFYDVGSSSIVNKGWRSETGFLNNNLQRIHDSDYYQYFSYSLKSPISIDKWDSIVSSLNHTAGFKKFSDLNIDTKSDSFSGISTSQEFGDYVVTSDYSKVTDLNCINDFDLVRDLAINIDGSIKSNEILFESAILEDYIESVGNKVLTIDNISESFSSQSRLYPYSVVDEFRLNSFRSKKYIIYIVDDTFVGERQVSLLTLIHNNSYGFINQYAVTPTVYTMGFFDFNISGDDGQLLFYPTKNEINNFTVNYVSYDMIDSIVGVGTTSLPDLGNVAFIGSSATTLNSGLSTSKTVVGIATTYRSSKVLVQIGSTNNSYYQYDELTVIHDGTNVNLLEYGKLTTNILSPYSSSGLGTYSAYISGSNLNIDFHPYTTLDKSYNVNLVRVSISNTSYTGIGSVFLTNNYISSNYVSIASSSNPVTNKITSYNNTITLPKPTAYGSSYCIVSIEDTTNKKYQVSEVMVVDDKNNAAGVGTTTAYVSVFATVETNGSLGTFSADVVDNDTILYFTPIPNINCQVRVFQHSLGFNNIDISETIIEV